MGNDEAEVAAARRACRALEAEIAARDEARRSLDAAWKAEQVACHKAVSNRLNWVAKKREDLGLTVSEPDPIAVVEPATSSSIEPTVAASASEVRVPETAPADTLGLGSDTVTITPTIEATSISIGTTTGVK